MESNLEKSRRVLSGSGEGVKNPLDRTSRSPELLDDIGLAVAAVNDHGKHTVMGQGQVAVEPFLLIGKWGAVPVSIQPGFTDRNDPGPGRQLDDAGPIIRFSLGDVVGLNSHGGENAMMAARDLDHGRTVGGRGADCDDLDQSGRACPLNHAFDILLKTTILEMGVSIDECPEAGSRWHHPWFPFPSEREGLVAGPLGASA